MTGNNLDVVNHVQNHMKNRIQKFRTWCVSICRKHFETFLTILSHLDVLWVTHFDEYENVGLAVQGPLV